MIKVAAYIAQTLAQHGIKHVFMLTGGGAMHLNDALGKHSQLNTVFNHHEQACAIAAESYSRLSGNLAVVNVTTGPGGLNTLTGVLGAWTDSIPMLIISGQVRYDTTVRSTGLNLRQLGDQEYDIVKSVSNLTKYAIMATEPNEIKYHLEKAIFIATHGRPGPVWLDIPMNIQGAMIEEKDLKSYDPIEDKHENPMKVEPKISKEIINRIEKAERPVILAGSGIRLSGAHSDFLKMIDLLKIPVTTAWNAHDVLYDDHPYYFGRPGSVGDRPGNFVIQNSDLLMVLGCRLNIRQIGYNWQSFAREAYKILVDIDELELQKPTINIDLPVHADLKDYLRQMLDILEGKTLEEKDGWIRWCKERKSRYPVVLKEYWVRKNLVNPYCFMHSLSQHLPEGQITVTGDGTACVTSFQAMTIKKGQRLYTNSGCAPMGYDLPAAIGACVASGGEKIVCLAGDGSIMLNLQELETIVFNQYPIKIFILNNNGYHSIRQTQDTFFGEPHVGCDPESGLGFPDFGKVAQGFGIPYICCENHDDMDKCISSALNGPGPSICEVMLTPEQQFAPKLSSKRLSNGTMVSKPLEDLAPFLERSEFEENMIIEPLVEGDV